MPARNLQGGVDPASRHAAGAAASRVAPPLNSRTQQEDARLKGLGVEIHVARYYRKGVAEDNRLFFAPGKDGTYSSSTKGAAEIAAKTNELATIDGNRLTFEMQKAAGEGDPVMGRKVILDQIQHQRNQAKRVAQAAANPSHPAQPVANSVPAQPPLSEHAERAAEYQRLRRVRGVQQAESHQRAWQQEAEGRRSAEAQQWRLQRGAEAQQEKFQREELQRQVQQLQQALRASEAELRASEAERSITLETISTGVNRTLQTQAAGTRQIIAEINFRSDRVESGIQLVGGLVKSGTSSVMEQANATHMAHMEQARAHMEQARTTHMAQIVQAKEIGDAGMLALKNLFAKHKKPASTTPQVLDPRPYSK